MTKLPNLYPEGIVCVFHFWRMCTLFSKDQRIHSWCIGGCSGLHYSEPSAFRVNLYIGLKSLYWEPLE